MTKGRGGLGQGELARLAFHGAAGEVTGSRTLLRTRRARVLFDCGLVQGGRDAARRNAAPFPFDPRHLDAVVLTHAHIDHSGLLPRLVKEGYGGPLHVTAGTRSLAEILLADSAHIHEQEAAFRTRRNLRRGKAPVEPLYTVADAEAALRQLEPHPFGARVAVAEDVTVRFRAAGHILGAASLEVFVRDEAHERKLVLSGDLGRADDPLLVDPDPPADAELVVMESTYGDRDHRDMDATLEELAQVLNEAQREGGNVIVPVFAVGRAQELLYHLGRLEDQGRVPVRPTFLDSPMAIDVTRLYRRHAEACREAAPDCPIATAQLAFTREPARSMAINAMRGVTILAASGMCEGGRVVHHLKHQLWRRDTHLVFVGFQAEGSLGRALVDGARQVRVLGERIAVAAKVHTLGGFSAHAGQSELLRWVGRAAGPGAPIVLVHGEDGPRSSLAAALAQRTGRAPLLPGPGEVLSIPRSGSRFELAAAR